MSARRTFLQTALLMTLSPRLLAHPQQMSQASSGELRLLNVTTVTSDLHKEVIPQQNHGGVQIRVQFQVSGGKTQPFDLFCSLAGYAYVQHFDSLAPGPYFAVYHFTVPLEDNPEARVVLDPAGISGDKDRSNNAFTSKLRIVSVPGMPALQRIEPQEYLLVERLDFRFDVAEAGKPVTIGLAKVRNTATVQVLQSAPGETAEGDSDTVEHIVRIGQDGHVGFERRTRLRLYNMAINPAKLEKIGWEAFEKDPGTSFTRMSAHLDGDSETVRTFVAATLGADYRSKMSPFIAAKTLFRAIKAQFQYEVTDNYIPSQILRAKRGQCASGSRLMCALLRQIGIPARTVGGFFVGQSGQGHEGHRLCEFYFPDVGWIPCDPTPDEHAQPEGNLYQFGNQWQTNRLWVTYADDAVYDCGFGPGLLKGPKPLEQKAEFVLQKANQ